MGLLTTASGIPRPSTHPEPSDYLALLRPKTDSAIRTDSAASIRPRFHEGFKPLRPYDMYGAEKINRVASRNEDMHSEETNPFPKGIRISPSPSPRCQHHLAHSRGPSAPPSYTTEDANAHLPRGASCLYSVCICNGTHTKTLLLHIHESFLSRTCTLMYRPDEAGQRIILALYAPCSLLRGRIWNMPPPR
jgi:hypothetical protein